MCVRARHPSDLCEGVIVWRPPVGLFNQLTVHLILQLWVGQAHLQGTLGQGHMVVDGRSIDGHIYEELTRLQRER